MNVSEALREIRNKTNDRDEVGMDDEELLAYFNEAVTFISNYLVSINSPIMIQEIEVSTEGTTLPADYIKPAGLYPVRITGNTIQSLEDGPVTMRCFVGYPKTPLDGEIVVRNEGLIRAAIRLASIYVSNQQELDVSQDKVLLAELQNAILAAVGAPVPTQA